MNRRNRTMFGIMLFTTMATHMLNHHYSWIAWGLLAGQFLVYPQIVYYIAQVSAHPRETEMINVALDGFFCGIWAAVTGFPVWITFIFFVSVSINLTLFHGKKGFAQAILCMLAGASLEVLIFGANLSPDTGLLTTTLSIVIVAIYVLIVADSAYARAIKLHETRQKLKASEYALKQQLEEINQLQEQLRDQAYRDALTGLYNRRYIDVTLERELMRCQRDRQALSVVIIDIDLFKQTNDTYGHQAGDEVLKLLAAILNEHVRASDIACRYGGEEFLLLLPTADAQVAQLRVEQCRKAFAATSVLFGKSKIPVTLSAGIATYPHHGTSGKDLISLADLALYQAKDAGRNQVRIADAGVSGRFPGKEYVRDLLEQ